MISFTDAVSSRSLGRKYVPSPRFGKSPESRRKSPQPNFSQTTYLAVTPTQNRPRGLAKGQFFVGTSGYFQVTGRQTPQEPRGKRQFEYYLTQPRERSPGRKRLLDAQKRGDPILRGEDRRTLTPDRGRKKVINWRPSGLCEFLNDKKLLRPAERGVLRGQESYERRNKSQIFAPEEPSSRRGKRSVTPSRGAETKSLLQYEFALPYREEKLPDKPLTRSHAARKLQTISTAD